MRRWIWPVGLLLLLFLYLRWLAPAVCPYAGGSDSSGYLWSARLFRQAALSISIDVPQGFPLERVDRDIFSPLGGRIRPGTMSIVPTYPTGLPLHLAAAGLLLPEEPATKVVLLLAAAGALWLLYLLGRQTGLPPAWAAAGCAILALSPLFLFLAVQPLSDVLATFWAEAAVLCGWRARRRQGFAWLAGVCLGMATLVRPTNLMLVLPVLAAMPALPGSYGRLLAGGLPFALFVAVYQRWAYGNPFSAGYDNVASAFSLHAVPPTLWHYLTWTPRLASWTVIFLPLAIWAWRGTLGRWRLVAAAWLMVIFGTYALYAITSEAWWYMRFVLPAFPILIVASLAGFRAVIAWVSERLRSPAAQQVGRAVAAVAVVACCLALVRSPESGRHRLVKERERVYQDALTVLAMDRSGTQPVLMMQLSGAANYYRPGMRYLRYDAVSPDSWSAIRGWQRREGISITAAFFDNERDALFGVRGDRLPCGWQPRGRYLNVEFWECSP